MADEAPIAPVDIAPAPAVDAVVEAAPIAEPVAAEAIAEAPSLIEAAPEPASDPDPVVEPVAEPAAEAPAEEPPAEAVEAAPPSYTDFTFPEGVQAEPEQVTAFTSVIGKYGLTQEAGQELIDLHAAELKRYADGTLQRQQDAFDKTRENWRGEVDRRFGNRRNTVLDGAKWLINDIVPDAEARKSLYGALAATGAGDHPDVINLLAAAASRLRERSAPPPNLPAKGQPANPWDARYGQARS